MNYTKPTLTIAACIGVLGLWSAIAAGQDDTEDVHVPSVPLQIEFIDGDVAITNPQPGVYVISDRALHEKIASLEALILSTLDEQPAPPSVAAVNINDASYDELLTVPGIGPVKAGSIVAERGQNGQFADWADLMNRVSGVGPSTIADIQAGGALLE